MTTTPANKVIAMRRSAGKLGPQAADLLLRTQNTSLKMLKALLQDMLGKADDALFDLANKATSNTAQQLYFDAMRDIRLRRGAIEQGFSEAIKKTFDDFIAGRPVVNKQDSADAELGLELVDVEHVEEMIAIKNMSDKVERQCQQDIYEITVRLGELTKRQDLEEDAHPICPSAIAHAFGDTISPLDLDIQVKLVIYKLFEKYVMVGLYAMLKEVNGLLIKEGILPTIKRAIRKGHSTGLHGAHSSMNQLPPDYVPSEPAAHFMDGGSWGGTGLFAGIPIAGGGLIGALSALQTRVVEQGYPEDLTPGQIGLQVLDLSKQLGGSAAGGMDEQIINMVSMIFDYILDDQNIPDAIKGLLGRLQIPVLKVALLDKEFFNRKKHPARRLLNEMAQAAIGWEKPEDGADRLFDKIQACVNGVLTHFEDDPGIFEQVLEDFLGYRRKEEERAQVFEDRTQKTVEGKERVEFVKKRTDAWIEMWTSRPDIPVFISDFLRNTWRNTLLITMHRHGEDSKEWVTRIKTVNNLLWSIAPKKTREGRKLLVDMLPGILQELRDGMEMASAHPSTVDSFLNELGNVHAASVSSGKIRKLGVVEPKGVDAPDSSPESAEQTPAASDVSAAPAPTVAEQAGVEAQAEIIPLPIPDLSDFGMDDDTPFDEQQIPLLEDIVEEIILGGDDQQAAPDAGSDRDTFLELAESISCGSWLEFNFEDGQSFRAKLSWKSPMTSCCLFVNRKGVKVLERSTAGLAADLRSGRATVLEDVPLLERALNAFRQKDKA